MEIGLQLLSSSWGEREMSDSDVYKEELELALRAGWTLLHDLRRDF